MVQNEGMKKIVVVDDDILSLMNTKEALQKHFDVYTVPSAEKLFQFLKTATPDAILLDIEMPEMDGYEAIRILKSDPLMLDIPVIYLTDRRDRTDEFKGLSLGAVDYISKPFSPPLLIKRLENHLATKTYERQLRERAKGLELLVEEETKVIFNLQEAIFSMLAAVVEFRDDNTGSHIKRTQSFLHILVERLLQIGLYRDEVKDWNVELVVLSSQLHDIGKVAIPDSILLKTSRLSQWEFNVIKSHTILGEMIIDGIEQKLQQNQFIKYAKLMVVSHHEKWDGTGYPYRLSGHNIPLLGRCMAIVDVYDALISVRPYKKAFPHAEALRLITEASGTHFDPLLVEAFLSVSDRIRSESRLKDHASSKWNIDLKGTNIDDLLIL